MKDGGSECAIDWMRENREREGESGIERGKIVGVN
jgi:hypothetical protein